MSEEKTVNVTIDGKPLTVPARSTILEAALNNGIYIPNLCYDRRLKPFGGCRLCLVEVEGQRKLFASCSTPIRDGMAIKTESESISRARKVVLELLLIHHPLDCPVCDKAGECDLQDLAYKYGTSKSRFKGKPKHGPEITAAPLLERNPNRCILCGKCVRICAEHQGVGAINFIGRGFDVIISPAFEETLDCEFCGQCIDICPVGALGSKPYRYRSRVWYMQEVDTVCPHCGCGCTVTLGVREGKIVRSRGKDGAGLSKGDLCGKGRFGFDYVGSDKRLKSPLIKKDGALAECSWEEAFEFINGKLKAVKAKGGGDAIGAIGSPRCTMEDNYMFQKFMRSVVGTPNIDSVARFGYTRALKAFKKAYGVNSLPVGHGAPLKSDFIMTVESDITSTHPVWGLNILKATREKRAGLLVVDPKSTKLSRHSTDWLRCKPGSGVAVINGMMRVMLDEGIYNKAAESTQGFGDMKAALEAYTVEQAASDSGIDAERIKAAARAMAAAKKPMVCLTLAASENTKGTGTVLASANILMLLGAGPDALQVPAELANTLGMIEAGVRPDAGPNHTDTKQGLDLEKMIYAEGSPIKAMYIMGENPMVTFPEREKVEKFLKGLDLLVVQDIMMNDTAEMAHVVLPAAAWTEKEGTFVAATGDAQYLPKCTNEAGSSTADWMILRNLARAMGAEAGHGDLASLQAEIKKAVPMKFSAEKATPAFSPVTFALGEQTDGEYPLRMVLGNLMQHSGSMTVLSRALGSVVADAYVQINKRDAGKHQISDEGYLKVSSRRGEVLLKARVTDEVPEGMLFVPAHFPHAKVNTLTYPASDGAPNVVAVKVERA